MLKINNRGQNNVNVKSEHISHFRLVFLYLTLNIFNFVLLGHKLFHDGDPYHKETSSLIFRANQWTGFYMIATSVIKELNVLTVLQSNSFWINLNYFNAPNQYISFVQLSSYCIPSMTSSTYSFPVPLSGNNLGSNNFITIAEAQRIKKSQFRSMFYFYNFWKT